MTLQSPNNISIFPVVILNEPRQSYEFLKMFFQQEKLPEELTIEWKNIHIKNVKQLSLHYISTYEYLLKTDQSFIQRRSAKNALYWLEILYREVMDYRKNRLTKKENQ